jgi:tetratricopeptide (TPR) repeat protein
VLITLWTATVSAQSTTVDALLQAAKAEPRNAAAQTELGRALLRAGQLDEAERVLRKAAQLQRGPGAAAAAYEILNVTFARGDHRTARSDCAQFKRVAAGTPYEHLCFARAFLIWHRASRAIEYLNQALALDADHMESLLALGDAERMGGNYDAADRAYERVRTSTDRVDAYLGLARVAIARGDRPKAINLLRAVLERAQTWPEVLFELGHLVDGPEALELLRQAAARRANWDVADLALGDALLKAGQAADAERSATAVIARNPQLAEAHTLLGRARQAQGNPTGAEQALDEALTLVPNLPEATLARADLYAATERHEEAFAEYQKAAGLRALDPDPLLRAARLCIQLQRSTLAAAYLDRALERAPRSALALSLYGDVKASLGDRTDALAMYQRALTAEGELDRAHVQDAISKLSSDANRNHP